MRFWLTQTVFPTLFALAVCASSLTAQTSYEGQILAMGGDAVQIPSYPTSPTLNEPVLFQKRRSVIDANSRVVVATQRGDSEVIVPRVDFYTGRGVRSGARVWLAVFPDRSSAMGFSQMPTGGTYSLSVEQEKGGRALKSTLASTDGMRPSGSDRPLCGTPEDERSLASSALPDPLTPELLATKPLLLVDIAVETDSAFFVATGRDLQKAQEYTIALYSAVNALYEDETHIVFRLSWLRTWTDTTPDPYSAAGDPFVLRDRVKAAYSSAYAGVPRDLLQVLTAISYGGGGYGYYNALCGGAGTSSFSAVSVQGWNKLPAQGFTYDVYITAHELGHNFNAEHSHSCYWGAPLDTCEVDEAIEGGCFQTGITPRTNPGSIMSYCGGRNYSAGLGYTVEMTFLPIVAAVIRQTAENVSCLQELNAPVLIEPIDQILEIDPEVTFRWNTDSLYAGYRLAVSTDSTFNGDVLHRIDSVGVIAESLLPLTRYYWYVEGVTRLGTVVASPVWTFSTTTGPSGVDAVRGSAAPRLSLSADHAQLAIALPGAGGGRSIVVNDLIGRTLDCPVVAQSAERIVLDVSRLGAGRYFVVAGQTVLSFVLP